VGAIRLEPGGKPTVQAHLCQGCGTCAARCPALAIQMNRCSEAELTAQITAFGTATKKE
jgi:heterodisulfide reductase subunit A-like polyferredoxin